MSFIKSRWPLIILVLLGLCVFIITIYDTIFNKEWKIYLIASYIVLIVLLILTILLRRRKPKKQIGVVEQFEKTLKGGLYHFKCPTCSGIFAIKKSKSNDKKSVKMSCPDCGVIGFIPPHPVCIKGDIPKKKSIKANFRCIYCGEGITVWAEGKELYNDMIVYSCPFCGVEKRLDRI